MCIFFRDDNTRSNKFNIKKTVKNYKQVLPVMLQMYEVGRIHAEKIRNEASVVIL